MRLTVRSGFALACHGPGASVRVGRRGTPDDMRVFGSRLDHELRDDLLLLWPSARRHSPKDAVRAKLWVSERKTHPKKPSISCLAITPLYCAIRHANGLRQ